MSGILNSGVKMIEGIAAIGEHSAQAAAEAARAAKGITRTTAEATNAAADITGESGKVLTTGLKNVNILTDESGKLSASSIQLANEAATILKKATTEAGNLSVNALVAATNLSKTSGEFANQTAINASIISGHVSEAASSVTGNLFKYAKTSTEATLAALQTPADMIIRRATLHTATADAKQKLKLQDSTIDTLKDVCIKQYNELTLLISNSLIQKQKSIDNIKKRECEKNWVYKCSETEINLVTKLKTINYNNNIDRVSLVNLENSFKINIKSKTRPDDVKQIFDTSLEKLSILNDGYDLKFNFAMTKLIEILENITETIVTPELKMNTSPESIPDSKMNTFHVSIPDNTAAAGGGATRRKKLRRNKSKRNTRNQNKTKRNKSKSTKKK